MSEQSFTTTFSVDQSPADVFAAINNVRGWWSQEIDGGTDTLGDEFSYRAQDLHRCKMKLTEVIPDQKAVWLVLDNYFSFVEDQNEWTGTEIIFEISEEAGKTEVRFTHKGLVPDFECYGVCSNAWSTYVNVSLPNLITTGKGQPNPKET
jgi:hypothetical protein